MASIQGHVSNLFVSHNESFALVLPDGNGLKASVTDVPRKSPDPSIKNTKKVYIWHTFMGYMQGIEKSDCTEIWEKVDAQSV